jgi:hypothetical protein
MKWNYRQSEVESSRICPSGIVYRPVARLRIGGSNGNAYLRALIDTGADHTLVPFSIAEDVGAELFEDEHNSVEGISGHEIAVVPGRVHLELLDDVGSLQWTTVIGFAKFASPDDECSVLGHAGCLEYFHAAFDGMERVVELTLRGDLPRAGNIDDA